jgi:HAD superfamily hydrolase (TIGR01549 family)
MIAVIILDFDGVILESVDVKTEAFRKLFSSSPDHLREILAFHLENGGISRFDKFRYIYREILKKPLSEEVFERLCRRFADLVIDGVLSAPFVPGAQGFLDEMHHNLPLYIVSATPEEEIREIVRRRGLTPYFTGVFGSPGTKDAAIRNILAIEKVQPASALFVGDALNDLEAARVNGVRFAGRIRQDEQDRFTGKSGVDCTVPDLKELKKRLLAAYTNCTGKNY